MSNSMALELVRVSEPESVLQDAEADSSAKRTMQRPNALCFLAICRAIYKHQGETIAFRLNATSDIMWENLTFNLSPDVADFAQYKFGIKINC